MKIFKKLITITLAFGILLSCCPASVAAAEEGEGSLTDFFVNIGIYSDYDNMDYENEVILREEMASLLSVFFGITENEYAVKTNIPDVPEYWASGHIATVINYGVMSGYQDGLFRPQLPVTVEQAIAVLVKLTGYEPYAQATGGYPTGYYTAAAKSGITKGVELGDKSENITKGKFTELLYNAINAPLFKTVAISQGPDGETAIYKPDNYATLLSENLHIYKRKGVMEALPYVTLDYTKPSEGTIRISNIVYKYTGDAYNFLGESVDYYYRQKKDETSGEVLHIEANGYHDNLVIAAEDIMSATTSTITYARGNSSRSVALPSDVMVIFNGKRLTYFIAEHLKPKQGSIKLVNADGDNDYETVIVDYEMNYIVESVKIDDNFAYITDRDGKATLKIELENDAFQVYYRGRSITLDELKKGYVISVCADSVNMTTKAILQTSSVYRIYASEDVLEGTVKATTKNGIKVQDTEYELVWDINKTKNQIVIGKENAFYLNYKGEIAGVKTEGETGYRYAILQDGYEDGIFQTDTILRLYDQAGEFVIATCSPKLSIDGKGKSAYSNALTYLKSSSAEFATKTGLSVPEGDIWQLIKYTINNEKITKIDTISENANPTSNDLTSNRAPGKVAEKAAYASSTKAFARNFILNSDTLYFNVGTDRSALKTYNTAALPSYTNLTDPIAVFDMDDDFNVAVVLRSVSAVSSIGSNEYDDMMIVEEILSQVNADGDVATYVGGTTVISGVYVELELETAALLTDKTVAEGDIIRWATDQLGVVQVIEKSFSPDYDGVKVTAAKPEGDAATGLAYGKVKTSNSEGMSIYYQSTTPANSFTEPMAFPSGAKYLLYDTVNHKTTAATAEDIRSEAAYGSDADMIFIYRKDHTPKTFVIYR